MAYDTNDLIKQSLKAIKEHELYFIEHVCAFIGINKGCFYDHKLHENNEIKNAIEYNKIIAKTAIIRDWAKSKTTTDRILFFKLIGTEEERKKLSQTYIDLKSSGDINQKISFIESNGNHNGDRGSESNGLSGKDSK